ncbi:hypothetical protein [Priestia koreensis]|uniref:hypothetical protein n=1 Tax=Priestia koreensis TaxID=284581 RepID=UPI001F582F9A|nr:hypothetical protein [Priestia koreensis]UNL84539.1 hypothetical protein IE339_20770 [Priestia koreensis]
MSSNSYEVNKKETLPLLITVILIGMGVAAFFLRGPDMNLWIPIWIYAVVDLGFVITFVWSFFTKVKSMKWFTVFLNVLCLGLTTTLLFFLLLAVGLSGPN